MKFFFCLRIVGDGVGRMVLGFGVGAPTKKKQVLRKTRGDYVQKFRMRTLRDKRIINYGVGFFS